MIKENSKKRIVWTYHKVGGVVDVVCYLSSFKSAARLIACLLFARSFDNLLSSLCRTVLGCHFELNFSEILNIERKMIGERKIALIITLFHCKFLRDILKTLFSLATNKIYLYPLQFWRLNLMIATCISNKISKQTRPVAHTIICRLTIRRRDLTSTLIFMYRFCKRVINLCFSY